MKPMAESITKSHAVLAKSSMIAETYTYILEVTDDSESIC